MDRTEAARRLAPLVSDLPAKFMMDGPTYEHGGSLGFDGVDFYVAGRGGVLGEVDADIVTATFVWFEPDNIRGAWDRSGKVMTRAETVREFAGCCERWATTHLDEQDSTARLAELVGLVEHRATPAAAPLFAGWRLLPEPSEPRALLVHRLNALRELRGALHAGCVLGQGVSPLEALSHRSPYMVGLFGWSDPAPADQIDVAAWERAEAETNVAFGRVLSTLTDAEVDELVALAEAYRV